jgi:hypothetical protein
VEGNEDFEEAEDEAAEMEQRPRRRPAAYRRWWVHSDAVTAVAVRGGRVVSVAEDGACHVLPLPEDILAHAHAALLAESKASAGVNGAGAAGGAAEESLESLEHGRGAGGAGRRMSTEFISVAYRYTNLAWRGGSAAAAAAARRTAAGWSGGVAAAGRAAESGLSAAEWLRREADRRVAFISGGAVSAAAAREAAEWMRREADRLSGGAVSAAEYVTWEAFDRSLTGVRPAVSAASAAAHRAATATASAAAVTSATAAAAAGSGLSAAEWMRREAVRSVSEKFGAALVGGVTFKEHTAAVWCVAIDRETLVTGDADGNVFARDFGPPADERF